MDALTCIYSRRSIREYKADKEVSDEQVNQILAAACSAPSAHNARPWEFVVVRNKQTIKALSKVKDYYKKPLRHAPLAIAVVLNPNTERNSKLGYKFQDCAAAAQNITLAANALGLGTCWMGGFLETEEMEKVNELLRIPETKIFFGVLSVGYPAEEKPPRGQMEPEHIHYETF